MDTFEDSLLAITESDWYAFPCHYSNVWQIGKAKLKNAVSRVVS